MDDSNDIKATARIHVTDELEDTLDMLFRDARISARDFKPGLHQGRLLDEIDDDIEEVRKGLGIEL